MSSHFNKVEIHDNLLYMEITKPITKSGYEENFLPQLQKVKDKYGEIRSFIYYKEFKGWEEKAALNDMYAILKYGKYYKKIAMVNPPTKEIAKFKVHEKLLHGEIKMFDESEYDQALAWVKE